MAVQPANAVHQIASVAAADAGAPAQPGPAWLQRLRERADRPPDAPRRALLAEADGPAIGSIEDTLALRLLAEDLPLVASGAALALAAPPDAALEAVARWLHARGLAGRWRDERLAVTDAAGSVRGRVERAAVRPLGITTHAVHLVGCDPAGRVWVQQRADDKATDPGLWDTLVGGLVAADETVAQTLERETWEEAGLRVDALQAVTPLGRLTIRRPVREGYMVEQIEMFEALVPAGLRPDNQDGEVQGFACLERAVLLDQLAAGAYTLEAALILAHALRLL
jgi:8-oxo-dGTP pyrophosphatase MutT (NUDIX family)